MHLHDLSSPSKVTKIWSHKKMIATSKKSIDELYYCRIRPYKILSILNHDGDINEPDFTSINSRNYLSKTWKNNNGWHFMKVLEYFQYELRIEEGVLFKMEADENN